MPYPTDAESYSDAEDTPPEHPPAHTAECPECQFSHQQTKTAANETRASSQKYPLLSLIFVAGTQSFDRAEKDLDGLRARDTVPVVQHEVRNRADAKPVCQTFFSFDLRHSVLTSKKTACIQAGGCCDAGQDGCCSDVRALFEICFEEGLNDRILPALLSGKPDKTMGQERIRCLLDSVERK